MTTPQRHLSQTYCAHDELVLGSDVCITGALLTASGSGFGLEEAAGDDAALEGRDAAFTFCEAWPRSRSPMFGRSRISGVQYWRDAEVSKAQINDGKGYGRQGRLL
jgi:hypothetical protein